MILRDLLLERRAGLQEVLDAAHVAPGDREERLFRLGVDVQPLGVRDLLDDLHHLILRQGLEAEDRAAALDRIDDL